jgi:cytochrome P450
MTPTTTAQPRRLAPGPRGRLFSGMLPELQRDPISFMEQTFQAYGDVSRYRLGPITSHLIAHPDGIKHVLQEHVRNYTKDHLSYSLVRQIAGNGLLTSQGSYWLRQRRLVQPAFHRQRIAAFGSIMVHATNDMCQEWQNLAVSGQPVDIVEEMGRLTLRIVGEALFGTSVGTQARQVGDSFNIMSTQVVQRFRSLNLLPPVLPSKADRTFRAARAALDAVVYGIIRERRARPEETDDLIWLLMQIRDEDTGEQMDDKQLRDEVLTMLVAGHETTATTLSWAFALLAQHPNVEAKLHSELASVLAGRLPTMADLPQLSYTRMITDEAMRLYPPVYLFSRKVMQEDEIGGYRIPAGTSIDISPYITHRHPDFWDRPHAFEPERFASELRHRYAYLPFSSGPRQCIGNNFALMEMTLILATLAQRYRLHLLPNHSLATEQLITLRPKGGLPMYIETYA